VNIITRLAATAPQTPITVQKEPLDEEERVLVVLEVLARAALPVWLLLVAGPGCGKAAARASTLRE
jgi:hypothetical protein